jgi:hypothetical protein
MITFNSTILQNWKSTGYKYIYVLPLKKYSVLKPSASLQERRKGYTIPINELERFPLAHDCFMAREKDSGVQRSFPTIF